MAYEASEIMTAVALQSNLSDLEKVKNQLDLKKCKKLQARYKWEQERI